MARSLGFYETCCKVNYELLGGDSQVMTIAELSGALSPDTLRHALRVLQRRHPFLHVQELEHETGEDYFSSAFYDALNEKEQLAIVPLQSFQREHDDMWQHMTSKFVSDPVEKYSRFHWHIVHLDGVNIHNLLLFTRHELTDGTSSVYLLRDLIELCGHLGLGKQSNEHALYDKLPFKPAIETQLPQGSGEATEDPPSNLSPWPYQTFAPLEKRKVNLVFRCLPADLMARLKNRSKLEGVTLNSALSAAYFQAEFESFQAGTASEVMFKSAISLRKYCHPPLGNEHLGTFVMMIPTVHRLGDGRPFWALAQEIGNRLKQGIEETEKIGFLPTTFKKQDVVAAINSGYAQSCVQQTFGDGPWISNLGVLPFEERYGDLRLEDIYFGSKQIAGDSGPVISISTFKGKCNYSLSACEPLITKETLEQIADLLFQRLDENC